MSNKSRTWIWIGFGALIVIGVGLMLAPLLSSTNASAVPAPIPTALIIEQSNLPYPDVPRIKVQDARAAVDRQQAIVVDARSATQYARSHIPGAKSMPLNELESRLGELNKDQLIITYCT